MPEKTISGVGPRGLKRARSASGEEGDGGIPDKRFAPYYSTAKADTSDDERLQIVEEEVEESDDEIEGSQLWSGVELCGARPREPPTRGGLPLKFYRTPTSKPETRITQMLDNIQDVLKVYDLLGQGAFGKVWSARSLTSGQEFVVKEILQRRVAIENWCDNTKLGRVPREISALNQLIHPNVVEMVSCFEDGISYQIVMRRFGCNVINLMALRDKGAILDESLQSWIFRQMVAGLAHVHQLGLVHHDVKPNNFIINNKFQVQVIDFGECTPQDHNESIARFSGTSIFHPPEALYEKPYDGYALDVWGTTMSLIYLIFGKIAFRNKREIKAYGKGRIQLNGNYLASHLSEGAVDVILQGLHRSPGSRATMFELLSHAWVLQAVRVDRYKWEEVHGTPTITVANSPKDTRHSAPNLTTGPESEVPPPPPPPPPPPRPEKNYTGYSLSSIASANCSDTDYMDIILSSDSTQGR